MKKGLIQGIAGVGLLVLLSSCNTQKQTTGSDVYAIARTTQSESGPGQEEGTEIRHEQLSRSIVVPQLQVDALSVYKRMITYITPEEETAPVVSEEKLTAYVDFPANGIQVNPKYGNNSAVLTKLGERLGNLLQSPDGNVRNIRIMGYASPDGDTKENDRLAGNRAVRFKNYLQKQFKLPAACPVSVDWAGEDWEGLQRMLTASDKKYRDRVLAIFQLTDDPDSRRKQIKAMDKGAVYKDIEKSFFSRLRRMELTVEMELPVTAADHSLLIEQVYTRPEKLSLPELLRVASFYRPGTEQYREIYEIAAYAYPSCTVAQLNAAAAALALGDKESARYFLQQVNGDLRACNNLGVLSLMDGDKESAAAYFRKCMSQNPRLSRENLKIVYGEN